MSKLLEGDPSKVRELTEDETEEFDGNHEHTNHTEDFCCPNCLCSSKQKIKGPQTEVSVVTCPHCNEEFLAWTDEEIVYRSAVLPKTGD